MQYETYLHTCGTTNHHAKPTCYSTCKYTHDAEYAHMLSMMGKCTSIACILIHVDEKRVCGSSKIPQSGPNMPQTRLCILCQ